MRPIVIGLAAGAAAAYYFLSRKRRPRAEAAPARGPRIGFGADANRPFYAARFLVGREPIEPEHVLACALYDPRLLALVRGRGLAVETVRADLVASARHLQTSAAEAHDYNDNETYGGAVISLRMLVSGRRAHQIAGARGATAISLGDLLRAFRERGGMMADVIPADEAALATFDPERAVDPAARTPAPDDAAGEVEVFAVNDERTTMDMVVEVLVQAWDCTPARAAYVMLETHDKGQGLIGRYPAAAARERVARATVIARAANMPLGFAVYLP